MGTKRSNYRLLTWTPSQSISVHGEDNVLICCKQQRTNFAWWSKTRGNFFQGPPLMLTCDLFAVANFSYIQYFSQKSAMNADRSILQVLDWWVHLNLVQKNRVTKGPRESIGIGKGRERKGRTEKEEGGERKSVPWWILLKMSWLDDIAAVELTRSEIFAHNASTEVQPADVYCMLLPPPRRLCCHRRLFVGMLVCLFARLQKPPNRFLQNLAEGCGAHGRSKDCD